MLEGSSTDRPWLFLEMYSQEEIEAKVDKLPGGYYVLSDELWFVLFDEWSGFDLIPHDDFQNYFDEMRGCHPGIPCKLDTDSHRWFETLPDQITIYRGQCSSKPVGLAWTTDRDIAAGFAKGHRGMKFSHPIIYQTTVQKSEVAIATNDRQEFEIVPFEIPSRVELIKAAK